MQVYQAWQMKRAMDKVAKAKVNAERERQGLPPLRPWYEDLTINLCTAVRETVIRAFCPCCLYDPQGALRKPTGKTCLGRLCLDGTYENQVLKNFVGFSGGLVLASLWFLLMSYHLEYSFMTSTITCILMGTTLSLGLAFSENFRCIILLALPQIFSSKGRAVMLAFAMVMVLNGPVQNFRHNIHVMAESNTCGQQMTKNATQELVDSALSPVKAMMDSIRSVLRSLMSLGEQLQMAFLRVADLFTEILAAIGRVGTWLVDMVDVCNDKMGSPYKKCKNAFDKAIKKCRKKLGFMKFLCNIVKGVSYVCHIARIGELLCKLSEKIKEIAVTQVQTKMSIAINDVYAMFYFNVSMDYHYEVTMNQSRSYAEIQRDIAQEIEERMSWLMTASGWTHWVLVALLAWLIIRALIYRHRFRTSDRYDNYYITFSIRRLDDKREEMDKETILPLTWRESGRFVKTTSLRLAKPEKSKLMMGLVILFSTGLHAGFYLACDYGLYWLLCLIRKHAELKSHSGVPSHLKMHVQGEGVLADIYRSLITQFDPIEKLDFDIDTTPCLPNPSVPDYPLYKRVGNIFAICLFLVLTEAYGLRLRHVIAGCYYPERERERAVWLYNHILRRRGGFLKFLRRQLRRKNQTEEAIEKISLSSRLAAQFPLYARLLKLLGYEQKYCLGCGVPGKLEDKENFAHCDNTGCKAVYCLDCFTDINNMCTVCMKPVDYGDLSDFSEERDSSDESVKDERREKHAEEGLSTSEESSLDYDYQNKKDSSTTSASGSESERSLDRTGKRAKSRSDLASIDQYDKTSSDDEENSAEQGPNTNRWIRHQAASTIQGSNNIGINNLRSDVITTQPTFPRRGQNKRS